MVDAVLLEWEGVLADTRPARRDALRLALAAEGIAHTLSDDDEQLRGLGLAGSVRAVLRHIGCSDHTLAGLLVARAARAFGETIASGLVLRPDALAFVQRMQGRVRVAMVTRAARAETDQLLRLGGLADAMTTVITADDVPDDAPAASAYQLAFGRLSRVRTLEPWQAVAVVDAAPCIRAARAAGVRVLAVGAPAHEAIDADAAVDSLEGVELDGWLALVGGPSGRSDA
jgi:beta-phosphoglucomutase-like phosphatase (HAD superfamily)